MTKLLLCQRDGEGNVAKVHLTFADALDVVRKLDNITLGLPRFAYLVGRQYSGHDSQYPAWDEVNGRLRRPHDTTALERLKWLMKRAKANSTTISLHVNMFDAFMDGPLWDAYLAEDIIAKDAAGHPIEGGRLAGMQSYQISDAREWELGYAQQRMDRLIATIPELQDAGPTYRGV